MGPCRPHIGLEGARVDLESTRLGKYTDYLPCFRLLKPDYYLQCYSTEHLYTTHLWKQSHPAISEWSTAGESRVLSAQVLNMLWRRHLYSAVKYHSQVISRSMQFPFPSSWSSTCVYKSTRWPVESHSLLGTAGDQGGAKGTKGDQEVSWILSHLKLLSVSSDT